MLATSLTSYGINKHTTNVKSSEANGEGFNVMITNLHYYPIEIQFTDHNCWFAKDLDDPIILAPNERTKILYTESDKGIECFGTHKYIELHRMKTTGKHHKDGFIISWGSGESNEYVKTINDRGESSEKQSLSDNGRTLYINATDDKYGATFTYSQ